jgi:O-antigen ligase
MAAVASAEATRKHPSPSVSIRGKGGRHDSFLWLLVVYLVLEFARPPVVVEFKLQMLIALALPLLCYAQIKDRPWSWALTCQLGIIAVSAIGIVFARNNFSAYMVTRTLYTTVAISVSMLWLMSRLTYFRRGMWCWTLIMFYLGLHGISSGGIGPGGFTGDENDLAVALNTAIPMAFFGAAMSKGRRRWAYVVIAITLVTGVVATKSRGGFVGLAALTLYCILISKHRIRSFAFIVLAGFIFFLSVPAEYVDEIVSIKKEAAGEVEFGTGDARLFIWHAAFNMWKAHPILGVGAGGSMFYTGEYQPDWEGRDYSERDWSGTAMHSAYVEVLADLGIVGVFLYGGMLTTHFLVLRRLRKAVRKLKPGAESLRREAEMYAGALSAGMVGFMASGAFVSIAYYPYVFYLSALAIALQASVSVEMRRLRSASPGKLPVKDPRRHRS